MTLDTVTPRPQEPPLAPGSWILENHKQGKEGFPKR